MTDQTAFHAALLDAAAPIPTGLTDGAGRPAGRRYGVYRNNVAVSLRDALETAYPAIAKLIGTENFHNIAGMYLRSAPPDTPIMLQYGAGFPQFLESLAPLAHLPYLGDVARIERAMRLSYHAADSTPADATILQNLSQEVLMSARLTLAPSVRILRSPFPAFDIWAYNMRPGARKPRPLAQDTLILRAEFDPVPHLLGPGAYAFVQAINAQQPLGAALQAAGEDIDLGAILGLLLSSHAITQIHI
ncbi:DNA-binding domain-containing protein [Puniceibacterium sediminis]|uniref:Putative DNA-binding domain-containing protein n=1 Tax=Puniceibacterium sediminis TaxID=1608407 RepID=A0A238XCT6_9RHOB|nr:DNA-binding domain-containing protein [Puniceibacterium sediminis]SNR56313.1 Putative DNA-binding domain-containing protein [Puniceibacterium sediminis]